MLQWARNPALEEELFARLRRKYIHDRTGEIHFSDTMYCLTKAYWSKTDPRPVDNDTLGMFSSKTYYSKTTPSQVSPG